MFSFIRMSCFQGPETGNYAEWLGLTLGHGAESMCLSRLNTLGSICTLAARARGWGGGSHFGNKWPRDGGEMVPGRRILPRFGPVLRLQGSGNDRRPRLDASSTLTSRTMLSRPSWRSCATPSSVMAPSAECRQGPLPRPVMRTFPPRPSGPDSW